ncbi:MAG: HD domain-containing protein [Spirochaetes bacterium]|nr:HD domain-containing protein [Spirochaetota bacterium]
MSDISFHDSNFQIAMIAYSAIESRISPSPVSFNFFKCLKILSMKCGIEEDKTEHLCFCAAFHDMGMVIIPDSIICKDTVFTSKDKDALFDHTLNGRDMILEVGGEFADSAAEIALTHHENYDGTGYPYGIKENEIPYYSRIVSVADSFDAMCSDRFHRKAYLPKSALELMLSERGRKYDPEILDNLTLCFDKLTEIYLNGI